MYFRCLDEKYEKQYQDLFFDLAPYILAPKSWSPSNFLKIMIICTCIFFVCFKEFVFLNKFDLVYLWNIVKVDEIESYYKRYRTDTPHSCIHNIQKFRVSFYCAYNSFTYFSSIYSSPFFSSVYWIFLFVSFHYILLWIISLQYLSQSCDASIISTHVRSNAKPTSTTLYFS